MHLEHLREREGHGVAVEAVVEAADAAHVPGRRRRDGAAVEAQDPFGVEREHVGLAAAAEEVVGADAVALEDGPPDRVLEGTARGSLTLRQILACWAP